jgi:hypothetical protein
MNSLESSRQAQAAEAARLFAELLSHLQNSQNSDGGWPFHPSGESRVEPACWAVLALANALDSAQTHVARGLAYLKLQQLPDASWPAAPGMSSGGWVTSLAALALAQFPADERSLHAALQWLCDDYPRDSSRWQKFLKSFSSAKQHASHSDEFRGWGWTPRTSSWVEPTAFALMALAAASARPKEAAVVPAPLAKQISGRSVLATGLLYDRTCAGGGWNCGNPRVYGVDGDSLILPTCWALLALRDAPDHPHRALSLAWLQKSFPAIASAGSLAVAQITLENYNLPVPPRPRQLTDFSAAEFAGQGTHIAAWAALALNPSRLWPSSSQALPVTNHRSPQ